MALTFSYDFFDAVVLHTEFEVRLSCFLVRTSVVIHMCKSGQPSFLLRVHIEIVCAGCSSACRAWSAAGSYGSCPSSTSTLCWVFCELGAAETVCVQQARHASMLRATSKQQAANSSACQAGIA